MKKFISTLFVLWTAGAFAQTNPTSFLFGSFASISPYNNSTGYTLVADSQIQPANLISDTNLFASTSAFTVIRQDDVSATFATSSNVGTITTTGASNANFLLGSNGSSSSFLGPDFFIEVQVNQNGTTSATDHLGLGIGTSTAQVNAELQMNSGGSMIIHVLSGGTDYPLATVGFTAPSAPWKFGFSLVGNEAEAWYNSGSGWQYITGTNVASYYDFTTSGNLTSFLTFIKTFSSVATTWQLSQLKTGSFGGVGIRDVAIITTIDGHPYVVGTVVYFMATIGGPNGVPDSISAICTLDLSSNTFTLLGFVFTGRSGHVYNDSAGALSVNLSDGTERFSMSTWATASGLSTVAITFGEFNLSSVNLLNPGNHVAATSLTINLPSTSGTNGYDPYMVCTSRSGSTCSNWVLAYTGFSSGAVPSLQSSSVDPLTNTWTAIGTDTGNSCEGSRIECMNVSSVDTYFAAYGCTLGSTSRSMRVYSTSMTFIGLLSVTLPVAQGDDNPPHASLFAFGSTQYLLTFDDNLYESNVESMGNLILASASATSTIGCQTEIPSNSVTIQIIGGQFFPGIQLE